ncbi:MAG: cell division ATP-binding protein FtsE [Candidatus Latescibacteria bacterium]|nr:cell division ATP-binding protein FtsE [Candidatus Latescibacterota bacterium]NIM22634.1 cell division ATP-binding protein FtsE [Candidatus Latescibacterota bacterium]NIM64923.1 cell division ATP-binding protein FtsE [Candidatus Latescibacterota bacterium]NIO01438.1 cell division ATP-binding protein FtsE [Candidatus Latescibacterota bacterium]NIO27948.1 cell division ATP-binding protein FtsE [Candidatus Latescibacterota bacterium]
MEERNVIGVYHLTKKYGDQYALKDVNLQVGNGEFVFLVGPSGAGKSTLLRLIYMDEFPTDGQVVAGSFVSTTVDRKKIPYLRRKIGVIFQDFKLLEDRDVFENVAIAMRVTGEKSYEIKKLVIHILTQVGLYHKRNDLPRKLSGGEQQRVAIARAIVNRPAILLADEPTGNLDPDVTEEILRLLFRINSGGTAVLMATHNLSLVENFGQRIVHLKDGIIHEDRLTGLGGNPSDKLSEYRWNRKRLDKQETTGELR